MRQKVSAFVLETDIFSPAFNIKHYLPLPIISHKPIPISQGLPLPMLKPHLSLLRPYQHYIETHHSKNHSLLLCNSNRTLSQQKASNMAQPCQKGPFSAATFCCFSAALCWDKSKKISHRSYWANPSLYWSCVQGCWTNPFPLQGWSQEVSEPDPAQVPAPCCTSTQLHIRCIQACLTSKV